MKIIGKTQSGFILEADNMEVQRLIGYYSSSESCSPVLHIGSELKVHDMYKILYELSNRKSELSKIQLTLRTVADLLEAPQAVVNELGNKSERINFEAH